MDGFLGEVGFAVATCPFLLLAACFWVHVRVFGRFVIEDTDEPLFLPPPLGVAGTDFWCSGLSGVEDVVAVATSTAVFFCSSNLR